MPEKIWIEVNHGELGNPLDQGLWDWLRGLEQSHRIESTRLENDNVSILLIRRPEVA